MRSISLLLNLIAASPWSYIVINLYLRAAFGIQAVAVVLPSVLLKSLARREDFFEFMQVSSLWLECLVEVDVEIARVVPG